MLNANEHRCFEGSQESRRAMLRITGSRGELFRGVVRDCAVSAENCRGRRCTLKPQRFLLRKSQEVAGGPVAGGKKTPESDSSRISRAAGRAEERESG